MDGQRGRNVFLSAHRCPEVDLPPQLNPVVQIPPMSTIVPPEKNPELTCPGEVGYLDILSKEEEEDNANDEGSISDWSEEDLSLHFSPSVILQSDDEEPEKENSFECVDVTMETQVNTQKGEGLKMVPKRQIQLRKKEEDNLIEQVILNNEAPQKGRVNNGHRRQDLLLRQHSMPIFQACSRTDAEIDSYRVYRGLVSGAGQGPPHGGNIRRLQKSLSLDETKTMVASCIIKNVLTKKMQVEQSSIPTKDPEKKPEVFLAPPPQIEEAGGGMYKAPVHVVRDVRSLVKHMYNLPFPTATTKPVNKKPTNFKIVGPKESPPPTYQQAVGVKGHIAMVTGSVSKSLTRKESDTIHRPIRESVISRTKGTDASCSVMAEGQPSEPSEISQSERAVTLPAHSVFIQPPPPRDTQALPGQDQNPVLGVSESAPGFTQQVLQPCFYTPTQPHLGKISFVHGPLNYMQTQQHPPPQAPTLHLPRRPEDSQNRSTESCSNQLAWMRATGDQDGWRGSIKPAEPEQQQQQQLKLKQQPQQQPFVCSLQVSADLIGPAAAPGTFLSLPPSCHLLLDPKSGRGFYVDTPQPPQRKMLLDPETGQFFQVFLPAVSSASSVVPVQCANPATAVLHMGGANPTVLSVMPFQPLMAVPTLYGSPCLPVTVRMPAAP